MKIAHKVCILLVFIPGLFIYSSCNSGIGEDLKIAAQVNDCPYIDIWQFNVTDGIITGEWDQVSDTITDALAEVTDASLDIGRAIFVYNNATYSLQYFIGLNGAPNVVNDYLISIRGDVDYTLVHDYTTVWEAQLYSGQTFLSLQTVTETTDANGFEGEIYLGVSSGTLLSVFLTTRDSSLVEADRTETACFTIP